MSAAPPVWFLDVDGVVNSVGVPRPAFGRYKLVQVAPSHESEPYPIRYAPAVVEAINRLARAGLVRVVWLTTWGADARDRVAPAVGLDSFETLPGLVDLSPYLGDLGLTESPGRPGGAGRWWKLGMVLSWLGEHGDRPVIWTDDDLRRRVKDELQAVRDVPTHLVTPMSTPGLTAEHLAGIETFARACYEASSMVVNGNR